MEHMCSRCARIFLQNTRKPIRPTLSSQLRPFSSLSSHQAPGPLDLSVDVDRSPLDRPATRSQPAKQYTFRKYPVGSPRPTNPQPGGQVLKRTGNVPPRKPTGRIQPRTQDEANILRQNRAALARPRSTQAAEDDDDDFDEDSLEEHEQGDDNDISDEQLSLLTQLSDDNIDNLTDEQITSIASELNLIDADGNLLDPGQYPNNAYDPEAPSEEDENLTQDETIDKYINEVIDPSPIPTESLPYTPKQHTTDELRLDWPNTPLSASGLIESVIQKVTWLAKRLPHGHWMPSQIAERYEAGHLVRFANEQEKETVLNLAADLANARAARTSERSGTDVQPSDMQFSSLLDRAEEKTRLTDTMVRGVYPVPEKQSRVFMDGVVRQLRNNETYKTEDAKKFVGRVERLIESLTAKPKGGQAQAVRK